MRSRHTIPCCRVEGWRKWRVFSRAGEPEESPLYLSAPRSHDDLEAMPPKEADKLYAERLGWLKDWIAGGTPWPDLARQKEIRNPPDEHPVDILIMAKMLRGLSQRPTPTPARSSDAPRLTSPDCLRLRTRSLRLRAITRRMRMQRCRHSSTACSTHRIMASAWRSTNWMSPATPIRQASRTTTSVGMPGAISITSFAPSTATSPTSNSSKSRSPETRSTHTTLRRSTPPDSCARGRGS